MHQIKRDSEPHLGSGKCILKNLIRKEILMDYRPSPHLRHFQNDKSQRPFILSFFPFSRLFLPVPLPPLLLISWALAFNCKRLQEHSRTVARQGSFINIYMHMKQANSKLSVSSWTQQPHCVCVYMQESAFAAVVWMYMSVCKLYNTCVCVPVFQCGTNCLTRLCPRPPEPPVPYQRPGVVFPTGIWSLAGLVALCLQG